MNVGRHKMKKIVPFILLLVMISCSTSKQTISITDIKRKETITIKKRDSQGNIHGISISGKGHVNGKAEIALILDGKPYKTENIVGEIEFHWGGDWYSDTATIEYLPLTVESGNLSLEYRFKEI
ncbi:MAG: hypothetical protein HGA78_04240 [Nitrospirales bacterium]|nr:hypothetical protein [Nitrospirales bacterium]